MVSDEFNKIIQLAALVQFDVRSVVMLVAAGSHKLRKAAEFDSGPIEEVSSLSVLLLKFKL